MHFTSLFTILALFTSTSMAAPPSVPFDTTVTYDNTYDNPTGSLNSVACSNGANGLVTKGYTTFNSLPNFPYIGGAQAVAGWNSTNCGSCWSLTYNGNNIYGKHSFINFPLEVLLSTRVLVTAIDTAGLGFNIAQEALDKLTDGHAVQFGKFNVTAVQVPASKCGF
ncbi:hypothetical protein M422DRAFT_166828 [Sphaerobolus stellatus SS14]|uniref:Cerato-platanin n=1 Tax=Sphaerobolus stellatus (strain SS14) TaxID=990650 RepID=A0A0C9W322_SPHS4|nr:hypothetical protein M422DRAFT_166828 [Sphaerobolus stellatus SS14]